jgi:hypothetical protein
MSRRHLLDLLTRRAVGLGVRVEFEREVEDPAQLASADVIVACDGVSSRLRRRYEDRLKTQVVVGRNRYAWLGTSKVFDAFTFAFVETGAGWIWFHAYGFASDHSTCIVECSPETCAGLGLDRLGRTRTYASSSGSSSGTSTASADGFPRDPGRLPCGCTSAVCPTGDGTMATSWATSC